MVSLFVFVFFLLWVLLFFPFCLSLLLSPFPGVPFFSSQSRNPSSPGRGGERWGQSESCPNIRVEIPLRNPTQVCQAGNCTSKKKKKAKLFFPLPCRPTSKARLGSPNFPRSRPFFFFFFLSCVTRYYALSDPSVCLNSSFVGSYVAGLLKSDSWLCLH